MYITKFSRAGDKFTIEGKAESPNTVAEFLRGLEASEWYRNAFMNSFLAGAEQPQGQTSLVPRPEAGYGTFVVTADLDEPSIEAVAASQSAVITEEQVVEVSASEVVQ